MPYISKKKVLEMLENGEEVNRDLLKMIGLVEDKCELCGSLFIKRTNNMIYCEKCRKVTYDKKARGKKKDRRSEYKKMYMRKLRGKITEEEFNKWKEENS